ncbi:hypothetical protein MPSEU_000511300 [Mayamaea pseudoterrestris]|nr:hypothetical protein MPSEU_000511300 [Mayamaea pseudoterrestris]
MTTMTTSGSSMKRDSTRVVVPLYEPPKPSLAGSLVKTIVSTVTETAGLVNHAILRHDHTERIEDDDYQHQRGNGKHYMQQQQQQKSASHAERMDDPRWSGKLNDMMMSRQSLSSSQKNLLKSFGNSNGIKSQQQVQRMSLTPPRAVQSGGRSDKLRSIMTTSPTGISSSNNRNNQELSQSCHSKIDVSKKSVTTTRKSLLVALKPSARDETDHSETSSTENHPTRIVATTLRSTSTQHEAPQMVRPRSIKTSVKKSSEETTTTEKSTRQKRHSERKKESPTTLSLPPRNLTPPPRRARSRSRARQTSNTERTGVTEGASHISRCRSRRARRSEAPTGGRRMTKEATEQAELSTKSSRQSAAAPSSSTSRSSARKEATSDLTKSLLQRVGRRSTRHGDEEHRRTSSVPKAKAACHPTLTKSTKHKLDAVNQKWSLENMFADLSDFAFAPTSTSAAADELSRNDAPAIDYGYSNDELCHKHNSNDKQTGYHRRRSVSMGAMDQPLRRSSIKMESVKSILRAPKNRSK